MDVVVIPLDLWPSILSYYSLQYNFSGLLEIRLVSKYFAVTIRSLDRITLDATLDECKGSSLTNNMLQFLPLLRILYLRDVRNVRLENATQVTDIHIIERMWASFLELRVSSSITTITVESSQYNTCLDNRFIEDLAGISSKLKSLSLEYMGRFGRVLEKFTGLERLIVRGCALPDKINKVLPRLVYLEADRQSIIASSYSGYAVMHSESMITRGKLVEGVIKGKHVVEFTEPIEGFPTIVEID